MVKKWTIAALVCTAVANAVLGVVSYWKLISFGSGSAVAAEPGLAAQFWKGRLGVWHSCPMESEARAPAMVDLRFAGIEVVRLPKVDWPRDPEHDLDLKYVILPFWFLTGALLSYPAGAFVRGCLRQRRRRSKGLCVHCGYDLRGSPTRRCPECGLVAGARTRDRRPV